MQRHAVFGCLSASAIMFGSGADAAPPQETQTTDVITSQQTTWALQEVTIDSSDSAGLPIPARFHGVWALDASRCDNFDLDPPTIITVRGFRREEIWDEAQEIRSISADGSEIHLIMGYQFESVDMILYDSRWILSDSDNRLRIDEANLWSGADDHEKPHEDFVRCSQSDQDS